MLICHLVIKFCQVACRSPQRSTQPECRDASSEIGYILASQTSARSRTPSVPVVDDDDSDGSDAVVADYEWQNR